MTNAISISFIGKISFDPTLVGKNNAPHYNISVYTGKDKTTNKGTYMNFSVTDWHGSSKGLFKKGDYVKVSGDMKPGCYIGQDGTSKSILNVNAESIEATASPWEQRQVLFNVGTMSL